MPVNLSILWQFYAQFLKNAALHCMSNLFSFHLTVHNQLMSAQRHGVPTMFISELALMDKLEAGEHVEGLSDIKLDLSELR